MQPAREDRNQCHGHTVGDCFTSETVMYILMKPHCAE